MGCGRCRGRAQRFESQRSSVTKRSSEIAVGKSGMTAVKGQYDPREEFFIAVVSVLIAPLVPLMIEFGFTKQVSAGTLLVSAIMYVASLAFSTDKKYIFFIGFFAVAFLCLVYGSAVRVAASGDPIQSFIQSAERKLGGTPPTKKEILTQDAGAEPPVEAAALNVVADVSIYYSAIVLMLGFGIAHLLQRIRMHLKEAQPFLDFRVTQRDPKG